MKLGRNKMDETAIVIDDDKSGNELLSQLLEASGIKVVGKGYDGKEALELFSKYHPNYSLIDLFMPNFDGFFAIENIHKINPKAQLFVLTGDTTLETKKKLDNLEITGLVYKPYEINDLIEILRSNKT
jgi:DNA-binding NarL/FixJ family response regulator